MVAGNFVLVSVTFVLMEAIQPKKKSNRLDIQTFIRVRKLYAFAFLAIAFTVISAQVLIQQHLTGQLDDSRVINVAGGQRAYSQKLFKEVLLLNEAQENHAQHGEIVAKLKHTLWVWQISHDGLQHGNDSIGLPRESNAKIISLFKEVEPHHSVMVNTVEHILANLSDDITAGSTITGEQLSSLKRNESAFLEKMDAIVNEYDAISKEQLQQLKLKEYGLLFLSLLLLVLEVIFIFRPLSIQVRETIRDLLHGQRKAEESNIEIQKLYLEKEESLQQLQEINYAIDNAALFANISLTGSVQSMSKKFMNLLRVEELPTGVHLARNIERG